MDGKKNSEARIKANNKYNAKAYDRINIAVPKGRKAEVQAHAESQGESINGFIGRAIESQMERDSAKGAITHASV
jgi:predicted HicB family RNase H-like nuclease